MLDPRLRTLQLVVHHGSVTAAAQALHFTPSAVSQQVRALADDLGVDLVHFVGRRMEPTAAGRVLLRHLGALQARAEQARAELADTEDVSGTIGLCGFSTAAMTLLAPAAAALRNRFPDLVITVVEAEPARCVDLLLAGDSDLALVVVDDRTPSASDARFAQRTVLDDPIDLAVPVGHRLTRRARVGLRDAAGEDWIAATPGTTYYRLALSACQAAGFTPTIAHHSDEWATGAALAAHGLGIFLLPRLAPLSRNDVVRLPLVGPSAPSRRVVAMTRAGAGDQPTIAHAQQVIADTAAALDDRP